MKLLLPISSAPGFPTTRHWAIASGFEDIELVVRAVNGEQVTRIGLELEPRKPSARMAFNI
jgi:hypothetical protein